MENRDTAWHSRRDLIVPILLGLIATFLPMVVPMSWIWMLICCLILAVCIGWLTLILIKPVMSSRIGIFILVSVIVLLIIGGFYRVREQYIRDHLVVKSQAPSPSSKEPISEKLESPKFPSPPKQQKSPQAKKEPSTQTRIPSHSESKSLPKIADLELEFWGKDSLTFGFLNSRNESAQNPKYTFVITDLTNQYSYPQEPDVTQPLPIPTRVISDFVRPNEGLGSFEVLNEAAMQHVKAGDKLFGLVWVTCFNCAMTRTYWLYFEVGKRAWYSYNASGKDFPECIRTRGLSSAEIDTCIDKFIPSNERTIIPEKNQ